MLLLHLKKKRYKWWFISQRNNITIIIEATSHKCRIKSIPIEKEAALELAHRSRGTPRIANRLLRRVRDYSQVKSHDKIDLGIVRKALEGYDIDKAGLDALDRKVLKTLIENYGGGPAGIESLAATLNEEVDTLVDAVEPFAVPPW